MIEFSPDNKKHILILLNQTSLSLQAVTTYFKNIDLFEVCKRWWVSLALIPFMIYHLHQAYWTLRYNIFFSISYDFPFPVSIENFFVQNFLLLIHEAGHTFFGFFGSRTLTILGGSLYEIMLPAGILGYFLVKKRIKSTQLSFYLTGCACLSVAFYAADASSRQLPLIGGLGDSAHDWGNLLTSWNLLHLDSDIGLVLSLTGAACYIAALTVPLWMEQYDDIDIDINIDG